MYKLLGLIGTIALGSSVTIGLASTITTTQNISKLNKTSEINWDVVSTSIEDNFNAITKAGNNSKISSFALSELSSQEGQEYINKVQKTSEEYLNLFKNQNSSFDEVLLTLKQDVPEFAQEYEKELEDNEQISPDSLAPNKTNYNYGISTFGYGSGIGKIVNIQKLKLKTSYDFIDWLEISAIFLSAISIGAAIVSAAYWSNAWFFGISVPWAIASTAIAAAAGATATAIGIYTSIAKSKNKQLSDNFKNIQEGINFTEDMISMGFDIIDSLGSIFSILKISLRTAGIVSMASSWAYPPAFPIASLVLIGIEMVDVFFEY